MPSNFRIHELLKDEPEVLTELEKYATPGRTVDECHDWLLSRGYTLSRNAVWNWLTSLRAERAAERVSGAGKLASAIMDAAKESGGLAISDAAVQQLGQVLFEAAGNLAVGGAIDSEELANIALAMQRITKSKALIEDTRAEIERQRKEMIAAVSIAEKQAGEGKSGGDVIATIKKALAIT